MREVCFVTDPLCSWCWGMAKDVEEVRRRLRGRVQFDLAIGGINIDAVTPLAPEMAPRFRQIWARVAHVTGQRFGMSLPSDPSFVYNSLPMCRAVVAMRGLIGAPPFDFLHALQAAFFLEGRNTADATVQAALAAAGGVSVEAWQAALADPGLDSRVADELRAARGYGTAALPAVLVGTERGRSLLAGGYADAATLLEMIEGWLARNPPVVN